MGAVSHEAVSIGIFPYCVNKQGITNDNNSEMWMLVVACQILNSGMAVIINLLNLQKKIIRKLILAYKKIFP